MILLSTFSLLWPGKRMPLFAYLGPFAKRDHPTSSRDGDPVVLPITNFSLISNTSISPEQTQTLLYHVQLPNPVGPFSYL